MKDGYLLVAHADCHHGAPLRHAKAASVLEAGRNTTIPKRENTNEEVLPIRRCFHGGSSALSGSGLLFQLPHPLHMRRCLLIDHGNHRESKERQKAAVNREVMREGVRP
jgi:hypothetical protein